MVDNQGMGLVATAAVVVEGHTSVLVCCQALKEILMPHVVLVQLQELVFVTDPLRLFSYLHMVEYYLSAVVQV